MSITDLAEPCELFGQELDFNRFLGKKDKQFLKYHSKSLIKLSLAAETSITVYWKEQNIPNERMSEFKKV